MQRISSNFMNEDMQFWTRRRESELASTETKLARQTKINNLRDDPLAAARAVRFSSVAQRLDRYEKTADYVDSNFQVTEVYARQAQDILQKLREIAVKGANGIFTKEDQQYMGLEVNQLLDELVQLANAKGPDGSYIFAGAKNSTPPFSTTLGRAPGADSPVLVAVRYTGDLGGPVAEVAEGNYIAMSQPGSEVFWAENQKIISTRDGRDWQALADTSFSIDGAKVQVKAGDNIYAVAAKINDSGAPVKASIDPVYLSLSLEATTAHQIILDGLDGGKTVLSDLGILAPTGLAPNNISPDSLVSGGSLFDVVMRLRDSLNKGDALETGGVGLAGIDAALENINRRIAEMGARSERVQSVKARLNKEIPETQKALSQEADLDFATAITNYRMLELVQQANNRFAGRLFPQTLMDFLR